MIRFICIFIIMLLSGCGIRERELRLEKQEQALVQKEQELALKEKTLQIKEAELNQRKQSMDSTVGDTAAAFNPLLPGAWEVKMTCTEASCPGSAVGDIRNETWYFSYLNNSLVVKAMFGNTLVRVYTGTQKKDFIELQDIVADAGNPPTRFMVQLNGASDNTLEGTRVIDRNGACRIVFSLTLNKK